MENLINFEEENPGNEREEIKNTNLLSAPLLVSGRLSLDLNNPFDKCEYRATHIDDPFDCLETKNEIKQEPVKQK